MCKRHAILYLKRGHEIKGWSIPMAGALKASEWRFEVSSCLPRWQPKGGLTCFLFLIKMVTSTSMWSSSYLTNSHVWDQIILERAHLLNAACIAAECWQIHLLRQLNSADSKASVTQWKQPWRILTRARILDSHGLWLESNAKGYYLDDQLLFFHL